MSDKLQKDLAEVVRAVGVPKYSDAHFDQQKSKALKFVVDHHAELAKMVDRIEIGEALLQEVVSEDRVEITDADRLMFVFEVDGFVHVEKDRYDYAMDVAEENGRDEPSAHDELEGVRRLIDAAMSEEQAEQNQQLRAF